MEEVERVRSKEPGKPVPGSQLAGLEHLIAPKTSSGGHDENIKIVQNAMQSILNGFGRC